MAPKKKQEVQKLSLGEFMQDTSFGGSWADEVEDTYGTQPLPPSDRRGPSTFGGGFGSSDRGSYAPRDNFPQRIPDRPPYTAHLGNLSYDATQESVADFFANCEIVSVRIVEDREQQRPKGFGYVEFTTADSLQKALDQDGVTFQGRSIRVRIADPPKDRDGRGDGPPRELDWSMRKGPLADIQTRSNDRRSGPSDFGDRRGDFNERRGSDFQERRPAREPADDGKVRDFSDWSRKGPLSPRPEPAQSSSREGSRPPVEGGSSDFQRNDRRGSPAAWGEGRQQQQQPQQEGSRPPRREFVDRPERVPSAADRDMQWRSNMRPDNVKSPGQSRSGSEAPPSPAPAAAVPAGPSRPRLNLAKRTISEAPDVTSPALTATDSKASPFGAARPIDTAAKEREIEQKRIAALQKQKEAEEKAKEEQRLAKEAAEKKAEEEQANAAAAKEAAEKAAAAKEAAAKEAAKEEQPSAMPTKEKDGEAAEKPTEVTSPTEQKAPSRQREAREPLKTRATESGNWRQSSGEHRGSRGTPTGPRRGAGLSRGGRHDGQRPSRANGGRDSQPSTPVSAGPDSTPDEDGWTTVKKTRGGARPIMS